MYKELNTPLAHSLINIPIVCVTIVPPYYYKDIYISCPGFSLINPLLRTVPLPIFSHSSFHPVMHTYSIPCLIQTHKRNKKPSKLLCDTSILITVPIHMCVWGGCLALAYCKSIWLLLFDTLHIHCTFTAHTTHSSPFIFII